VPPPPPAPEAPPPDDAAVEAALEPLRSRVGYDRVLAAEVADFIDGPWRRAAAGAVEADSGRRYCRVEPGQVVIGHRDWPGAKRIPL
jgi:hypothetical protein